MNYNFKSINFLNEAYDKHRTICEQEIKKVTELRHNRRIYNNIKTEYRRLNEVYYKRYQRISISKQDEKF